MSIVAKSDVLAAHHGSVDVSDLRTGDDAPRRERPSRECFPLGSGIINDDKVQLQPAKLGAAVIEGPISSIILEIILGIITTIL